MQIISGIRPCQETLLEAVRRIERGETLALVTIIETSDTSNYNVGERLIVESDGNTRGSLGSSELDAVARQKAFEALKSGLTVSVSVKPEGLVISDSGARSEDYIKLLIEPFGINAHLVIFGSSQLSQSITRLAGESGFNVSIYEQRKDRASPYRFPHADIHIGPFNKSAEELQTSRNTFILLLTENPESDLTILKIILRKPNCFIGLSGGDEKALEIRKVLVDDGFTNEEIKGFTCPIGLSIKPHTNSETAISIVAQLISLRNRD